MSFQEYYNKLTDEELIDFVKNESKDITPEAFYDLYQVVSFRGLLNIIREQGIRFEKPLSENELNDLSKKYMKSFCPICNEESTINAIKLETITGILIKTIFKSEIYIGCKNCLKNELMGSLSINLLSGWWSLFGIISTPFIILFNFIEYKKLNTEKPTRYFKEHIKELRDKDMLD